MKERIAQFNDFLADRLSLILSMMGTFYIILMLVIIPLFFTQPTSFVAWAGYLCSVIFQGIALPVLGYTARKASDKADILTQRIAALTESTDKIVRHLEIQQDEIMKDIDEIIDMEKQELGK